MKIKTLQGIATNEILSVFNASFSDYFIPFKLTQAQLEAKLLADKVDLNFSVGVFENETLIAFILHGFDIINAEKVVYNGGTGVIPEQRGSGLAKQMYHFILPILKDKGINTLVLEVITKNIQAIKSYEKSGYKTERALNCYKGEISIAETNNTIEVKELHDYNWKVMQSFWDISPTWQNSNNVVDALRLTNISLGAYSDDELVGYIIYNPNSKRVQQIAVSKNFRQQNIASTLVRKLINEYGPTLSIINVDKSSKSANGFLQHLGFKKTLEQLEMKLQLDKN